MTVKFKRPDVWGRFESKTHPRIAIQRRYHGGYDPRYGQTSHAVYFLELDGKIQDKGSFARMRKAAERLAALTPLK